MLHQLKVWIPYYEFTVNGVKNFDVRKNDRNFMVGDILLLSEWDQKKNGYTGRIAFRKVTYILRGVFGLPDDLCVMQLGILTEEEIKRLKKGD